MNTAGSSIKPDPGKDFIEVDFVLVSAGDIRVNFGIYEFCLRDETGRNYLIHPEADGSASILETLVVQRGSRSGSTYQLSVGNSRGTPNLGVRFQGTLGFQVDQGVPGLELLVLTSTVPRDLREIDLSQCVTAGAIVALGSRPTSLQPPANLPGEKAQQVFNIGDVLDRGPVRLVVRQVCATRVTDLRRRLSCDMVTATTSPRSDRFVGGKTVLVELSLENIGTKTERLRGHGVLKDSSGRRIGGYSEDVSRDTVPGDVRQYILTFILPDSFADPVLVIPMRDTNVFINIPSEALDVVDAVLVAPSAAIPSPAPGVLPFVIVGEDGVARPNPDLVEAWAVDDTGKSYTFRLSTGISLLSGVNFTAQQVYLLLEANKDNLASYEGSQPIDEFTIQVVFSDPDPNILSELSSIAFATVNELAVVTPTLTPSPTPTAIVGWHFDTPMPDTPVNDPRVRSAIDQAINEVEVDPDFFYLPNWPSLEGASQSYDPSLARQLIAEAGYPNGFTGLCIDAVDSPAVAKSIDLAKALEILRVQLSNVGLVATSNVDSCGSGRVILAY